MNFNNSNSDNNKCINIFDYLDYREYLNAMFLFRKKKDLSFSHRMFALKAGFKSSGFLKLVIDGKRNLTEDSIFKIAKAFELRENEYEYFKSLVYFNQSEEIEIKNFYYRKMSNSN